MIKSYWRDVLLNLFKKYSKFLLVGLASLMLTGCANVDYSRIIYSDGQIQDKIVVHLDVNEIMAAGYSLSDINILKEAILQDLLVNFTGKAREFLDKINDNNNITNAEKLNYIAGLSYQTDWVLGEDKIVSSITFKNNKLLKDYTNYVSKGLMPGDEIPADASTTNNLQVEKGLLINTYYQESATAYGDIVNGSLAPIYEEYSQLFNGKFTIDDVTFSQIYGSPNLKLKSNAYDTMISNDIKLHYWQIDPHKTDQTLRFYTYSPHTTNWYILAIIAALITVIVMLIAGKYKKHVIKLSEINIKKP